MAAIDEVGEETAHRIAQAAYGHYAQEVWNPLFGNLNEAGREKKFRLIMQDAAAKDPDLNVSFEQEARLETQALECAAEKIYREYGLTDYFRHFCDQDFNIVKMISPTADLVRPETLPGGDTRCLHTWKFNGRGNGSK